MTLSDLLDLSAVQQRYLAGALQGLLAGLSAFGFVTGQWGTAITAGLALAITLLPALLERRFDYTLDPGLLIWLALAVTIHTAGAMGLYEQFTWFDNIAHTVSAMVLAGVGYAAFVSLEVHTDEIDVPPTFRFLFIVVFVLATGVVWELLEFAVGDLLTVYGVQDIVTDMVFNGVGAVLVAVWGTGHVDGLIGFFRRRFRAT